MGHRDDLTSGSIGKKVIGFAAPIILANLIQAIYGIVDMIVVGYFVGASGMSAASMGAQITTVVLVVMTGLSNGGTVITAQLNGRGKRDEIGSMLGSLLSFLSIIAVAVTALVMIFCRPLLRAINTPDVAFEQAVQYLMICMVGTIFVYAYNNMAAVLRGMGNSRVPMLIVLATAILNIILDVLMVGPLRMGVVGAALATVISQLGSMVMVAVYIKRKTGLFDFKLNSFRINWNYLRLVVKIGLPQSIQFLFATTSFVFMSGLLNLYGVEASAAAGAAAKIQNLANLPAQGMMAALLSFTAQNLTAEQPRRVVKGMGAGMAFSASICLVIAVLCMIFPAAALRIFTPDAAVVAAGVDYLRCMAFSFVLEALMFCMFGVIAGSGYTPVTMCCGILSAFAVRYTVAWLFSQALALGFSSIGLAYVIGPFPSSLICAIFLISGKWKTIRVQVGK